MKTKFNNNREKKLKENQSKVKLLREKINTRTSDFINLILKSQEKLLLETKNIEEFLNKSLNEIRIETRISDSKNALDNNKIHPIRLPLSSFHFDTNERNDWKIELTKPIYFTTNSTSSACVYTEMGDETH